MVADISVNLTMSNHESYARSIIEILQGKSFNVLTTSVGYVKHGGVVTVPKVLKYCHRKLSGLMHLKEGQVSIEMTPGGSIAWDLNLGRVVIVFKNNEDIEIQRLFTKEKWKKILITQNPI